MNTKQPKFTPIPEKEQCVHGNMIVVITFGDDKAKFSLGDEKARCPYRSDPKFENFNPFDLQTIRDVCKGICKVHRQNLMVEKLAYEKVKIFTRAQVALTMKSEEAMAKSIEDATKGD